MRKRKITILGLCIGFVTFLAVYLGLFTDRGIPSFEISKVYSLPLGEDEKVSVSKVIVSDLTGDGREEILISYDVASYVEQEVEGGTTVTLLFKEARILILSSDAVGNFQKLWEHDSGLTRQTAATGDFDSDGKPDVVIGGYEVENIDEFPASTISRVEVLLQEDGSFVEVFSSNIPEFLGPGSIVAGDFNGGGRTDFVVGGVALENGSPHHAYLFRNEGGGNFTMSPIALREGIVVEDMWKADINNDGSPDLVIHALDFDDETYSIILLLNYREGDFEFRELDASSDLIVVEDFTGDAYPDIIYTTGSEVYFLRNDQGEFSEPSPIDIRGEERWFDVMIAGDFNNDGVPEVILLERSVEFREDLGRFETSLIGHLLLIEEDDELSFPREWFYKFLEGKEISSKHAAVAADIIDEGWMYLILVSREGEVYLALNQHT